MDVLDKFRKQRNTDPKNIYERSVGNKLLKGNVNGLTFSNMLFLQKSFLRGDHEVTFKQIRIL